MLADEYPHLQAEWMTEKNHPLRFNLMTPTNNKKVWWKCPKCKHELESTIVSRRSSNCPYCSGRYPIPGGNDLATTHPELTKQWHPTLNVNIDPTQVSKGSEKKVWWLGECGHEWEAAINRRVKGTGCPYCNNTQVLEGFNDFPTTHPTIASQWHKTRNTQIDPKTLVAGNGKKVWWVCDKGHEWEAVINSRTVRGQGCPYCSGRYAIPGETDITTTHPELAKEWHPTLNPDIDITKIKAGTGKRIWWLCEKGHEWETTGNSRLRRNCPYCAGKKAIPGVTSLDITHPQLLKDWDYEKNLLTPQDVTAGSEKKIWWKCNKGHSWETPVLNRTVGKNCIYCAGRKVLVGNNDLGTLYPNLVPQWHPTKNSKTISEVTVQSRYKAWWQCEKNHEWEAFVYARAGNNPSSCPTCSVVTSKFELVLSKFVEEIVDGIVLKNKRSIIYPHELDIYIPDKQIAVEFNGVYWHSEVKGKGKYYHYNKWKKCQQKGIELIQIWEDDWNRNPDLVKKMLFLKLNTEEKQRETSITNIREVSQEKAEKFFKTHYIQKLPLGGTNIGLYHILDSTKMERLTAMISLNHEEGNPKKVNIIHYATDNSMTKNFKELLSYVERIFTPSQMTVTTENTLNYNKIYELAGFKMVEEIEPDYMYAMKNKRVSKNSKPENNGFPRIWDAGKTKWEKHY